MRWLDIVWTDWTEAHIAEHGVSRADAEKIIRDPLGVSVTRRSKRWTAFGYARDGRRVGVVYELVDDITAYPITAFEVK